MTTPSDITVSLEKAKALKEAGWPQEDSALITWWENDGCPFFSHPTKGKPEAFYGLLWQPQMDSTGTCKCKKYAAPVSEEILRRLPQLKTTRNRIFDLQCRRLEQGGWFVCYRYSNATRQTKYQARGDSLADAAASLWIYLKTNNLLPSEP